MANSDSIMAYNCHFAARPNYTHPPVSDDVYYDIPIGWLPSSYSMEYGPVSIGSPEGDSHHLSLMDSSLNLRTVLSNSKTGYEVFKSIRRALFGFGWWWWWEIASLALALASLATLLGVITAYNGVSMTKWAFYLGPNSVISILTTTLKTAIMVSISMCFSQLKWHHFSTPRRLTELQVLDDASRGPWGSLIILLRMRNRNILTIGLAVATLAALAIEPTAQQLLTFPSRNTVLEGVSAEMGVAPNFDAKTYQELYSRNFGRKLGLKSVVLNAATGNISPSYFSCPDPAVRCSYPTFRTLGVCFSFHNTTDISKQICSRNNVTGSTNCTISWSPMWDGVPNDHEINVRLNYKSDHGIVDDVFEFVNLAGEDAWIYMNGVRWLKRGPSLKSAPRFEAFECLWYWCAQTYDSSIGSTTTVSPRLIREESLKPVGFYSKRPSNDSSLYRDNSTTNVYHLGNALEFLWNEIYGSVPSILHIPSNSSASIYGLTMPLDDINWFLYYSSDLSIVFQNIATVLSNIVRIPNTGENLNATVIKGQALGVETYIRIRWPWFILPVIEMIVAILLLLGTIIVTRESRRPLLKSSVNGLLFHGLDSWDARDTACYIDGEETLERLETLAERFKVSFREDEGYGLRFVRS